MQRKYLNQEKRPYPRVDNQQRLLEQCKPPKVHPEQGKKVKEKCSVPTLQKSRPKFVSKADHRASRRRHEDVQAGFQENLADYKAHA